jgi:hypothetical protein
VVALEYRLEEKCPDCRDTPSSHLKRRQSFPKAKADGPRATVGASSSSAREVKPKEDPDVDDELEEGAQVNEDSKADKKAKLRKYAKSDDGSES